MLELVEPLEGYWECKCGRSHRNGFPCWRFENEGKTIDEMRAPIIGLRRENAYRRAVKMLDAIE